MTFPNQLALISPADLQKLVEESMRKVMAEKNGAAPVGVVGVDEAANYLSISRRKLRPAGRASGAGSGELFIGTRRLWRIATLDDWAGRQEGLSQPKKKEAA